MKITTIIFRILTGLVLLVLGADKLFDFVPKPEEAFAGDLGIYMTGLITSKYIFPTLGILEMMIGISFLSGRFLALFATFLAPISYCIVMTHLIFDIAGGVPAYIVLIGNVLVFINQKDKFSEMLKMK